MNLKASSMESHEILGKVGKFVYVGKKSVLKAVKKKRLVQSWVASYFTLSWQYKLDSEGWPIRERITHSLQVLSYPIKVIAGGL